MKKIFFLFVLPLGLMSFTNSEKAKDIESINLEEDFVVCCTATVTYNGEVQDSFTACSGGTGALSEARACQDAGKLANAYIKKRKAEIADAN